LAVGEEDMRAQSRGEWPGVRRTFFRGFVGMEVCVGGGAREKVLAVGVRFGSCTGERERGDIRPWGFVGRAERRGGAPVPPWALCAELAAGNCEVGVRVPLARWAEFAAGKEGAGGEEERVKVGTVGVLSSPGLFGGEGDFGVGFLKGGGGGGIAFLSRAALLREEDGSSDVLGPSWSDIEGGAWGRCFATSWRVGRWSQDRNDHEDGGCR
jgi:hypothetical protein